MPASSRESQEIVMHQATDQSRTLVGSESYMPQVIATAAG